MGWFRYEDDSEESMFSEHSMEEDGEDEDEDEDMYEDVPERKDQKSNAINKYVKKRPKYDEFLICEKCLQFSNLTSSYDL